MFVGGARPRSELYRSVQFSIQVQLLRRKVKRFRGGLVLKAHRLVYRSTLGSRVIKKKNLGEVGDVCGRREATIGEKKVGESAVPPAPSPGERWPISLPR